MNQDRPRRWRSRRDTWDMLKPLVRGNRHESTDAETRLWQELRNGRLGGVKFRRQHAIDRYVVDFYASKANLVVEVDGPIHEQTREDDLIRQRYLESLGLTVLRFMNAEVLTGIRSVLAEIEKTLSSNGASSSPSPPGGEGAGG